MKIEAHGYVGKTKVWSGKPADVFVMAKVVDFDSVDYFDRELQEYVNYGELMEGAYAEEGNGTRELTKEEKAKVTKLRKIWRRINKLQLKLCKMQKEFDAERL